MRRLISLLCLLVVVSSVQAEDAPSQDLSKALTAFFAEADPGKRAAAGFGIAMRFPDAKAVATAAANARRWDLDAPKETVETWTRATADGTSHTIYAAIPAAYDPSQAWPVLIWLHGAVARPSDGGGASAMRALAETADEEGFILLAPSTQKGAEWWTPNGVELVRGSLHDLARRWRVDADRVAVTGFSDGASGCLHLLAHDPEPYCCFMPLMAHPGVSRMLGGPSFAANVRSRPVLAYSGGEDTLYPAAQVQPMFEHFRAAGCDMQWVNLEEAGHRINSVLPGEWSRLRDFWKAHPRHASPASLQWETGIPQVEGRFGWLEILTVDPKAPSAAGAKDARLPEAAGRPKLGVRLDGRYTGVGLRLEHVEKGTAAADAGFKAGDVLVSVDGADLEGEQARAVLVAAMAKMTDRDGVFVVRRGEQELTLKTRPRLSRAARSKALGYGVPSGRLEARILPDNRVEVTSRHVRRFKLHFADGMLDLSKPIRVFVNGTLAFEGKASGDTGYVLQQAARQLGGPAYRAFVIVTVSGT